MVKINGSSFPHQYRRTNSFPIDSTDIWDTMEEAHIYARNTDTEPYMPYAGQIISVTGNGNVYKLVKDDSIPETDEKKHFKLEIIGSTNDLDDRYLRNDIESTAKELINFLKGINAKGTSTLEEITLIKNIVSQNFAPGSTGFGLTQDEKGNYHLDIDFMNIRRKLTVDEMQIQQSSYIGGKQYNTAAGIICNNVEDKEAFWRCHFKTTDAEGRTVRNTFKVDDQAICETFNLDKQIGGRPGNHYYWCLVIGKGDDYIDLSKSDCDTGSDTPQVGDNIVQLGHRSDTTRQGAICWDSVTDGGPYVRVYKGITSYHLPMPNIDLNPEESVIKAKFVSEATGENIENAIKDIQTNLDLIKEQTDKEYTLWFFDYDPALNNLPASDWTTDALKALHEEDMFYNRVTGHGYRFEVSEASWAWNNITDQQTIKALENAAKAQDTADGKRRGFVSQPTIKDTYDVGDLWMNATYSDDKVTYKNDFLVCKTAKASGIAFSIEHWQPSSTATTAYIENLGDRITLAVTDSDEGIAAAKKLANQGVVDASHAAQSALEALGIAKSAEGMATENAATIQVTKDSIAALVQGIHFDDSGNITNINTSGLVTTDDFNTLLSKKITFDADGHVSNISTSGLVTESGFAQIFSEQAEADGYVKRAEISTFMTEDDAGRLISNAEISADQIRFNGNIVANDTFFVDEVGNLILNNITANNGIFNGEINATSGVFKGRVEANGIIMDEFAKLASAVFKGNYMLSQHGKDDKGVDSIDFEKFNPDKPYNGAFVPNLLMNLLTGDVYCNNAIIEGWLQGSVKNKVIRYNAKTTTYIDIDIENGTDYLFYIIGDTKDTFVSIPHDKEYIGVTLRISYYAFMGGGTIHFDSYSFFYRVHEAKKTQLQDGGYIELVGTPDVGPSTGNNPSGIGSLCCWRIVNSGDFERKVNTEGTPYFRSII